MTLRDFALQLAIAIIGAAVVIILGHAVVAVAIVLGVILAILFQQQRAISKIQQNTRMLAGITLTADDVLRQYDQSVSLGNGIEHSFRTAAERRAWEADQIKQHGSRNAMQQLAYSGTFEGQAKQNSVHWYRLFEELTIKLAGLGYRVFPPTEPSTPIAGDPTPEAIKFICDKEGLTAAAESLRAANGSNFCDARQAAVANRDE